MINIMSFFSGTSTPTPEEQAYLDQLMRQLDFLKDLVPWVFVIQIVYASIQFIVSFSLLIGIGKKPKKIDQFYRI